MRRHDLDLTSLVAGLVFVAIAVTYAVGSYTHTHVSAGLVLPLGLIGLGLAGLAGTLRRSLRDSRVPVESTPEPTPAALPVDRERNADDTP